MTRLLFQMTGYFLKFFKSLIYNKKIRSSHHYFSLEIFFLNILNTILLSSFCIRGNLEINLIMCILRAL